MTDTWDDLIKEAKGRLAEQEAAEQETSSELGESIDLAEGETFVGRFRGSGRAWTKRGDVEVVLLWDTDGARRFMWPKTRLTQELDELQPEIGMAVAIVRGVDIPSSDPGRSPTQRYAFRVRPCADPLPGEQPTAAADPVDDDIPFMPTV